MPTILQIPLLPGQPQEFTVALSETVYTLRLTYRDAIEAGWMLWIGDAQGNTILPCTPFVAGLNLIEPFPAIGLPPGGLYVASTPAYDAPITFDSLGVSAFLYYVTP